MPRPVPRVCYPLRGCFRGEPKRRSWCRDAL